MLFRLILAVAALVLATTVHAAPSDYTVLMEADAAGAADSEYTGRYEGSSIVGQTTTAFTEIVLPAGPADKKTKSFRETVSQKGKVVRSLYVSPEQRASVDVFGNYVEALKAKGFTIVYECADAACGPNFKDLKYNAKDPLVVISKDADTRRVNLSRGMFSKVTELRYALMKKGADGQETYVAVFAALNAGGSFGDVSKALRDRVGVLIETVDAGAREDKIITLSADDIGKGLERDGRAVIYGLFFDFDKATITPDSQPQLDEMLAYLGRDARQRVFVVGHTDNKGEVDYNVKLSAARAKAVVDALVAAGIDAKRLMPKGVGPFAPLAANETEDGRARNRRVELVAQ